MTKPDPVEFLRRALALMPADPADAGVEEIRALLELGAGLEQVIKRLNQAIDEALEEVNDYLNEIPGVTHPCTVVVSTSTTVHKQDPPKEATF